METLYYFGSVILGLGFLALQGLAAWAIIEGMYWVYCKLTGKEY